METEFYDITKWEEKPYVNTKGTRNKCVVINPENDIDYYFKTSIQKGLKDYKSEFWSEIIASKIGVSFGFNILDYNIAQKGSEIGCISKSMIKDGESLTEGINILTGFDNTYNPNDKKSYSEYTFQFILKSLEYYGLQDSISEIIETIIFDSIIGNSDRHQENWAFITIGAIQNEETLKDDDKNFVQSGANFSKIAWTFSPIYDSGCCLACEKDENAVVQMLNDEIAFDSFVNRGKSEIREIKSF